MRKAGNLLLTSLALVLIAGTPGNASAITNPIVDFGSGFAMENGRLADDYTSTAGDTLVIVGFVVDFNDPFNDLDPNDPTKEYTYVYRGLVSQGTTTSGSGSFLFYNTQYAEGTLEIYCDTAMNGDFADKSTFMDGDLILAASLSGFETDVKSFNCSGTQNTNLQFTGGSLFSRVSSSGTGYTGIATGLFTVCSSFIDPAERLSQGYFALSDTKIDVEIPVPVENRTWGEIKKQ